MAEDPVVGETTVVEFGVLGPLQATRAGRPVSLGGPRQRAVLAMLLLRVNRSASLDELVEQVWNGHPPPGAVTTVQTYVFHLRRALEPDRVRGSSGEVLATRDRSYLLRVEPHRVDATRFEAEAEAGRAALQGGHPGEAALRLRAALALWRGPVLADLADYEFVAPQAARLEELRLAALEARIDADLALGRHTALTAELDTLITEHPLREHVHAQLILALYRCGRQAEALAAYQRVRDLLADQLGIDPGPDLRTLHRAVLAHDPALDWRTPASSPNGDAIPVPAAEPAQRPDDAAPVGTASLNRARRVWRRRRLLAAGIALALVGTATTVVTLRSVSPRPLVLPANSVSALDSGGELLGESVLVGQHPDALISGADAVWAVNTGDESVSRIDPRSHTVVQTITVGAAPNAITVTGEDVWVTNSGGGSVSRISTATNRVIDTIPVGNTPTAIASGPSGVWVTNGGDDTASRIDPASGTVTSRVNVGAAPDGIAVGQQAVWVANGRDGTLTRINPTTGVASGPTHVGAGPAGLALTTTALWVANALDLSVWKLDPASGQVLATIPVGDGPHAIAATTDSAWVSSAFDATLTRIDARTNQITQRITVGNSPRGLAIDGSTVWVATSPFAAASHRGGTLTVASSHPAPFGIDPVRATESSAVNLESLAYDGLVGLRRTSGAAGLTLVPDLASALPRPTNGGKTYTFTLRPGIRYSTGATVHPADFVLGIHRALVVGDDSYVWRYYTGIVGAADCHAQPDRCDLSRGVVVDDATSTVTFHLTAPDPDFLHKLVLYVVPTPPDTPTGDIGTHPIPGTGPYQISTHQKGKDLTLTRNPHFRQWSHAATPDGYPDVIHMQFIDGLANQITAIQRNDADLVNFLWEYPAGPDRQIIDDLAVRYPTRLKSDFAFATTFEFLNTQEPPFNDRRVRQALNYAVDRHRIVDILGGPRHVAPTCQTLPPHYPSHRPYCPYTLNPHNNTYTGPDLATAQQLITDSNTRGMHVTVWDTNQPELGEYYVSLLQQLGYQATLHQVLDDTYWDQITDTRHHVQIHVNRWGADFPVPSNFFLPLITCAALIPASITNLNGSAYCNPHIDELIHAAHTTQLTDPGAARDLWAQVDRHVTDEAPWVAMVTPKQTVFTSTRVSNYQSNPMFGPLLDQIWVH